MWEVSNVLCFGTGQRLTETIQNVSDRLEELERVRTLLFHQERSWANSGRETQKMKQYHQLLRDHNMAKP